MPNDAPRSPAQAKGGWNIFNPVVHQDDVGLREGGVRAARAHPDSDIGRDQAGRVIYSVTHHCDGFSGLPPAMNPFQLFVRRKIGMHFLDSRGPGDGVGRCRPIARDERNRVARVLQGGDD